MYKRGFDAGRNNYMQYTVEAENTLLEYLFSVVKESRNKVKLTLKGRGVKVNGKVVTQFDYKLLPGMTVSVSQTKRNDTFKNRFVYKRRNESVERHYPRYTRPRAAPTCRHTEMSACERKAQRP